MKIRIEVETESVEEIEAIEKALRELKKQLSKTKKPSKPRKKQSRKSVETAPQPVVVENTSVVEDTSASGAPADTTIPEFLKDNPWVSVIARRGKGPI